MKAVAPGGRAAISGFLYQIVCSLGRVAQITVQEGSNADDCSSAILTLEPLGGDLEIAGELGSIVEQFKSRSTDQAWGQAEIIGKVLPDLLGAARRIEAAGSTRFRFVTNGRCSVDDLQAFLGVLRAATAALDQMAVLRGASLTLHLGHKPCSPLEYIEEIASSLSCSIDDPTLWDLLTHFEIIDRFDEAVITQQIDAVLAKLVEAGEDLVGKRMELIARCFSLAKDGRSISAAQLLRDAGLDPVRLHLVRRLSSVLDSARIHASAVLGYQQALDVRSSIVLEKNADVVVIAGESGQGKSWRLARMAHDLAVAGQLAVLLPSQDRLVDVERLVLERVWHSGGFDRAMPIANVAARLRPQLPGDGRHWLTICLDDLQSQQLARDIAHANWAASGIRIVVTASSRMADFLQSMVPGGAECIVVRDFTVPELRNYLSRQGRDAIALPDDVLALMRRPVLAGFYCRLGNDSWIPHNEYALLQRFWQSATVEYGTQPDHLSDGLFLKRLAATVLDVPTSYPWSVGHLTAAGLSDEARLRLVAAGLLKPSGAAFEMAHDRLLNWALAEWLVEGLQTGQIPIDAVGAIFHRIFRVDGDWTKDFASRKLGYVPMDVLWLLLAQGRHDSVGTLIAAMATDRLSRLGAEGLVGEMVPTLGTGVLPAFVVLIRQLIAETDSHLPRQIGAAIAAIGRQEPVAAKSCLAALLKLGTLPAQTAALTAAATLPLPGMLEQLWSIYASRKQSFDAVRSSSQPDPGWHTSYYAMEESHKALLPSVRADPSWITKMARGPQPYKHCLVDLLLQMDYATARPLWKELQVHLFATVVDNRSCLLRALRLFGETNDLPCLEDWLANGSDEYERSLAFAALARIAPDRALLMLPTLRARVPNVGQWSQDLFRHHKAATNQVLRETFGADWSGLQELCAVYRNRQDDLDPDTLRRILDLLTDHLEARPADAAQKSRGENQVLRFIAGFYRPELLDVLAERRGARLETLLVGWATTTSGRVSLSTESDNEHCRHILLKIGGTGLQTMVLHELGRATEFARTDGLLATPWTWGPQIVAKLRQMAADPATTPFEHHDLLYGLALGGAQDSIVHLLRIGASIPYDVIDMCRRRAALLVLMISNRPDISDLLADVLERYPAAGPEARLAVVALAQIGVYKPSFASKIADMLATDTNRDVVQSYLLDCSQAEARQPLTDYLDGHALTSMSSTDFRLAFRLLAYPESAAAARAFLRRLDQSSLGAFYRGELKVFLHGEGEDAAREQLYELAWQTRDSYGANAPTAIHALAKFDPENAIEAIRRQLRVAFDYALVQRLLITRAEAGFDLLVNEYYRDWSRRDRWLVCRAIRWNVPTPLLEVKLDGLSQSADADLRRAACEIAGWQTHDLLAARLDELSEDADPKVAEAATDALARQRQQATAIELLERLQTCATDRKWSYFIALLEACDPHLLDNPKDPLAIAPILSKLPLGYERTLGRELGRAYDEAKKVVDPQG